MKVLRVLRNNTEMEIDPANTDLEDYIHRFLAQVSRNSLHIAVICGGNPQWDASSLFNKVRDAWGVFQTAPMCITMREPVVEENISCDYSDAEIPSKCFVAYISEATDTASAAQSFWECIENVLLKLAEYHTNVDEQYAIDAVVGAICRARRSGNQSGISDRLDELCHKINPLPQTFIVMYLPECAFRCFTDSVCCHISQNDYVFLVFDPWDVVKQNPHIINKLEQTEREILDRFSSNQREELYYSGGITRTTENSGKVHGWQMGTTTIATNITNENTVLHHEGEENTKQTEDLLRVQQGLENASNHDNVYESGAQNASKMSNDDHGRV